jgi:ketosteroid isomerase-like protein
MNQSVELKNMMLRLYEAVSSGDVNALERLISHREDVLAIGTDPGEWWMGYKTIDRIFKTQSQEMGKVQIKAGELSTFVEGTVGWASDKAKIQLPNGQEIPVRVTNVFHQEDGEWKVVQHHVSVGVPNSEAIGKELTVK